MWWIAIAGLFAGALALLRLVAGLLWLARFVRAADIRRMPHEAGPPVSVIVPLRGAPPGLERNLEALLRQNHPAFEVLLAVPGAVDPALPVVERAARAVPDVATRVLVGPEARERAEELARHARVVVVDPAVRADPLFLRDVARGLERAEAVVFVPVLFGMRTAPARLLALLADTEAACLVGLSGGRIAPAVVRAGAGTAAVAARAARVHAPDAAGCAHVLASVVRSTGAAVYGLLGVAALAPALWIALLVAGPGRGLAAVALAAHLLLRAAIAVIVDLRFSWDRSLLRALPLLPLLWMLEPLLWLAGWTRRRTRDRLSANLGA